MASTDDDAAMIMRAITGAFGQRRLLTGGPVLPHVWNAYVDRSGPAKTPAEGRVDLLVSADAEGDAGIIAEAIRKGLEGLGRDPRAARVAANRSTVAAELTFDELVCVVIPLSRWWRRLPKNLRNHERVDEALQTGLLKFRSAAEREFFAFAATCGLLALMFQTNPRPPLADLARALAGAQSVTPDLLPLLQAWVGLFRNFEFNVAAITDPDVVALGEAAVVGRVQLNRRGTLSVSDSRRTIKADACENLFKADTRHITWAVVDGGIDARHPAFQDEDLPPSWQSRVVKTYDLTRLREILAGEASRDDLPKDVAKDLESRIRKGLTADWSLLREALEVPHTEPGYRVPVHDHGTHVAGILGGDWMDEIGEARQGVCPDIRLIDIRVFDDEGESDEFTVIGALQFLGFLNRNSQWPVVHGANLSFSFAHDVRNFACGQTPICVECERLVSNGMVVVAAAGNLGHEAAGDTPTLNDRFNLVSITDPGNAEAVITVGSTHRSKPHAYGVSFFSSRGPTGDGRAKPDLVAPGEKIVGPLPSNATGEKDGTSMAAPHVSGAAALLMARHAELIGRPGRIKCILMESATDLGREKWFQGAGLLDVLRAVQSV